MAVEAPSIQARAPMAVDANDKGAIVITGTSSGIGRATALLLASAGYRVFAGVRKPKDAESLKNEGSERLCPLILDITNLDQIAAAAALVRETLGPDRGLHGLVNNAGSCEAGAVECIDLDRLRGQFNVNVIGHVSMIQAFLPMVRQGHGRIVNVTSAVTNFPLPLLGAYAGSKCAFEAVSVALRRELRRWRIPVSIIEPGFIDAAIWDDAPQLADAMRREDTNHLYQAEVEGMPAMVQEGTRGAGSPVVVAKAIQHALEARSPKLRYRAGPGSRVAVFAGRAPARFMDWLIARGMRKWQSSK